MSHARAQKKSHKERVTLSLSSEATKYARVLRAQINAPSMSAMFEEMIRNSQQKTELEHLNARAIAYYDSLSPEALRDSAAWGEVGVEGLESVWENENPTREAEEAAIVKG